MGIEAVQFFLFTKSIISFLHMQDFFYNLYSIIHITFCAWKYLIYDDRLLWVSHHKVHLSVKSLCLRPAQNTSPMLFRTKLSVVINGH